MNDQIDIAASSASQPGPAVTQVLFVDSRVPDLQAILAASAAGTRVVVLDAQHNGVQQMAQALHGLHDVANIGVVSHGDPGVLLLGNGPLFGGNLAQHRADLQAIGQALGEQGDILLYGCEVGAGEVGAQFLASLAELTGADVAASSDSTGDAKRGGDWELEISTGDINAVPALDAQALDGYDFVLHTASVNTVAQLKAAITTGNTDGLADTITLTGSITFASAADAITINVTDGQTMTIVGGGFTLSGANLARVLDVTAGSVAIDNLTVSNGFVTGAGGNRAAGAGLPGGDALGAGIRNAGTLTITASTVTANKAAGGGGAGGNLFAGTAAGAGGGGGGFDATYGGASGSNFGGNIQAGPSAGTGGRGHGFNSGANFLGGAGGTGGTGTGAGGAGSNYAGYSYGGVGGTASNGTIGIGGGGGGSGYDAAGGRGGHAAGGIYNTGTLTITGSTITNNIGGGGGGGGGSTLAAAGNGGAGGSGAGGVWNAGGTLQMDAGTYATFGATNAGGAGAGGNASGGTNVNGAAGTATSKISTTGGGATDTNYVPPPTLTSATYDASTGVLVVTGADMLAFAGAANDIVANKLTLTGEGGSTYTLTDTANVEISSATGFTLTLSATDLAAVNQIVNKNGASSTGGTAFNLAAADDWDAGVTAGNTADASNGVTASNVAAPTLTSATYNAATGALVVTGTGFLKLSGATNDIDVSKLTLTGEGGATYTLTTTSVEITSGTAFTVTLNATDLAAVNQIVNKNGTSSTGTTTYNLAAAEDWAAGADAAVVVADLTGNGVTASNVAAPTITSATYNAATGALVVTGTGFLKLNGATNDIDVSKLTITGEGGATYTLTTTSVEITSGTAFTVTLNATDLAAVNQIANKNGTSSTGATTYNLAAAEDWAAGADTAVVVADSAGNGITVSNVSVPTLTSATYDASTGVLVVTGTGFLKLNGATNDIDVSKLTFKGEAGATRTLTTTSVEITSGTSFSVTLNGADQAAVNIFMNKNGTSSTGSDTYNLAAAEDWAAGADAAVVVADLLGNGITTSNVAVPTITSATYDASTGALVVTGTGFLSLAGLASDIASNKFSFTGEGGASYTLTDTAYAEISSGTSFTVTLSASDKAAVNTLVNRNGTSSTGGTTYNLAAAEDWASGADAAVTVADLTGNGVTVSNVAVPTITSATYNVGTGVLVVTGTGFLSLAGATNDIVANKFTFTGEGGATYTLTDTSNVEIASGTSFTITMSATDLTALDLIINKNGTSSVDATTYNLAAAEDWAAGAAGAVVVADLTGNGITASNAAAPTITSATYDASTNVLSVTGTHLQGLAGALNDVAVSLLTLTGEGGSYTLTSADVEISSGTTFSVTLNAADQTFVEGLLNKNGTSSSGATTYNLAAADNWMASVALSADLTGNGITVSNTQVPALTSASYDAATGALVVTGTNLVHKVGVTNDIVANKFTLTGEGGATYTLTDTPDVEVTSGSAFTLTLSATDRAAINQIVNKNGTSSTGATTYNLAAAEDWAAGADAAVVVADLTGNGITASNVAVPTMTSATYNAATGALVVTGTGFLKRSGATNDIDVSKLTLTGEGGATYTLTTASVEITSGTSFSVTLNGTDLAAVNLIVNKNGTSSTGATTYNLAAAEDWSTGADAAVVVADLTGNGITASNVAVPTITSSTYNASTGALVVTGSGFVSLTGASNDIVANKFTFTGEGGATYTLTDSANVEVTSATAFTLTLSATDQAAINQIVNKNGTSSTGSATYNLAAAEDWAAGADAAVVVADLTGNGITVSNVAVPTMTSATYNATTGALVVTGAGFLKLSGATNDIDVSKLTLTGEGGATYALTTTSVEISSGTSFTVTLNATDLAAVNQIVNKNGTSSTGATTYNLAAAEDWAAGADAAVVVADVAGNGITASNVAVPTITSATYDAAAGSLVVTGTGLLKFGGAANDVVANKLSLTGEGGASYTLTDSANVEISSGTAFTLTLSATDKAAVNLIVNKNGTSSTGATTYNLAAAEDWSAGAAAAVVVADLAGNGITVSNVAAPSITSATYHVGTGVLTVTGSGLLSLAGAANDITANRLRLLGQGAVDYTLTDTPNVELTSGTGFTMTMSATDRAALALRLNKDGTSATDTTVYNLGAMEDWNVGAATAVVIADLFGNGITVTGNNVPPVIGGAVAGQAVNDTASLLPFAGITITDADVGASETVSITLDSAAKGSFTAASLTASGFSTADGGLSYTHAAASPAAMQAAVRALVFQPTVHRVALGLTETTTFTVSVNDGIAAAVTNATTTVVSTSVNSAPTGSVSISGLAAQGETLTASNTLADLDGLGAISYQWRADGTAIAGAGATLVLGQAHVGKVITVEARYTDGASLAETTTSGGTAAVANRNDAPTGAVTVSGVATQGQTLTASNTLADIDGLGTISYQWLADGAPIAGASGNTLALAAAQVGKSVSVVASYTDGFGALESRSSNATTTVANADGTPTGTVSLVGNATQGQTLSASNNLSDANGLGSIGYQWFANGVLIAGATGSNLTLGQPQVGKVITVVASYTDGLGKLERVASAPSASVANVNDAPTGSVTISGTPAQGQTLSVSNTLSDLDGLGTISYQWRADGVAIAGASTSTLLLGPALVGKTITVAASYTDGGGTLETVVSANAGSIAAVVDGAAVSTSTSSVGGQTVTTQTVAPIESTRTDDPTSANANLADISLASDGAGTPLIQVGLPVGVGLTSVGSSGGTQSLRDQLVGACASRISDAAQLANITSQGIDQYLPTVTDPSQATLRVLTLNVAPGTVTAPTQPIVIRGALGAGEDDAAHPARHEVLVIDARELPPGTVLDLSRVEFAIIIGPATVLGGVGRNFVIGDASAQTIVLGPDDDTLNGGAGNDTIGSKAGNDQLLGDDGSDTLVGGLGDDRLDGGADIDLLVGGQSDAGNWRFSQSNGQLTARYSPSSTELADSTGWSATGDWTGGRPIDPRFAFVNQTAALRETIAELYQAYTHQLPTVEALNFWSTAGFSAAELTQGVANAMLSPLAGQSTAQQVSAVISQVWGADRVSADLVQIGSDFIAAGGTWAQVLQVLIGHDKLTAQITNALGELQLAQAWSLAESGWSLDGGSDTLLAGTGNDTLVGGRGNDVLDGGEGSDTAVWFGQAADFEVRVVGSGANLDVALVQTGSGEVDILRHIEQVQIGGQTYDVHALQSVAAVQSYLASHADAHLEVVLVGLATQV